MPVRDFLERIQNTPELRARVAAWHIQEEQPAEYAEFPEDLPDRLKEALQKIGITKLYTHQREAYDRVVQGENVLLVTPTASGKSLAYNLPVLKALLEDEDARAFYLFPTKALSQDQVANLNTLIEHLDLEIPTHTYDGDTPRDIRGAVRLHGRIVVTNPDMLHKAILPHHNKWIRFLENLRFIVIDEVHAYRGIFGSHVANVFRRLQRILSFYGAHPVYIATSATIGNPKDHVERLAGQPFHVIDRNGAPRGRKHFLFWNPPLVNRELGLRGHYLKETEHVASLLLEHRVKGIVFARSRINVEILGESLRKRFETRPDQWGRIASYRGGYLPKERRKIERGLREDEIDLVVSTNALELGIDIGSLDAAVMAGFPGTLTSTFQQAGRAGRRTSESLAILVASSSPIDQFLVRHPEYLLENPPEKALINPDNLFILLAHIKCAAFELPFRAGERFGDLEVDEILDFLEEKGVLYRSGETYHWTPEHFPADEFSLRTVSEENFVVVDLTGSKPQIIGEVDFHSAPMLLHEQAIYMHQGKQYQVKQLDYASRKAFVEEVRVEYYTDAIDYTKVQVLEPFEEKQPGPERVAWGEVLVTRKVVGFKKVRLSTFENVGFGTVHLPEDQMHTQSYWVTFDREFVDRLGFSRSRLELGLWGILHLLSHLAPLYLMCDPKDLGAHLGDPRGVYTAPPDFPRRFTSPETPQQSSEDEAFEPTMYLYETYPGGVGLSEELFRIHGTLLQAALDHIRVCSCESGCPSCVGPYPGDPKSIARKILEELLERS